jgi:hypothetical protein
MKVISIDAPCNGSGKTSLILSILSAFPNTFAFTKFTTIYGDEQFCPAKDHDCACHRLRGDYNICTDADVLSKPDTDTGKIWRAGAIQTLWCVSKPEGYPEMLREYTMNHLRGETPLLMEGSTVARHLRPALHAVVVNPFLPKSWWKDNAEQAIDAADVVVVNPHQTGLENKDAASEAEVVDVLERVWEKSLRGSLESLDRWEDQRLFEMVARVIKGWPRGRADSDGASFQI